MRGRQREDSHIPTPLDDGGWPGVTPQEPRITTFTSLGNRDYRWFWLSMLAAFGALHMQLIARNWLAYELTGGSALSLGFVAAAWGLPVLFMTFLGGTVTDRVPKRTLLVVTQAINLTITLVVAVLITTGVITLWHLVLAAFTTGVTFAFNAPGRQAFIPQLVPRRQLMNAIALNSTGSNLMRVLGYFVGGALIVAIGVAGVYYVVVGLYAASIVLLLMVSVPGSPTVRTGELGPTSGEGNTTSVAADLVQGLRYIVHHPLILSLLALEFIPVMLAMPYMNLLPVFAVDVFGRGPEALGFLMGAAGVGALVGALTIASLGDLRRKGPLLIGLALLFGVALAIFAFTPSFSIALVLLLFVGGGSAAYMAMNNTLIQSNITDEVRGRVMSVYVMTFALMPLGTLLVSAAVEEVGASLAVGGAGIVVTLFVIAMAIFRPTLRRL